MSSEKTTNGRALPTWIAAVDRRAAGIDADPPRLARRQRAAPRRCACRAGRSGASSRDCSRSPQLGRARAPATSRRGGDVGCPADASGAPQPSGSTRVDGRSGRSPDRYLGADPGFDATYHIKLCDLGHTWEVRCTQRTPPASARARLGARPDVTISTDADTWTARCARVSCRASRRSSAGCCRVRGNLDYAIGFEGLFRLPGGRPPLLQIHDVAGRPPPGLDADDGRRAPTSCLLHGLGGTRASLLRDRRSPEPPLPRPRARSAGLRLLEQAAPGAYNARWFAEIMLGLMDELEIETRPRRRQLDGRPDRDRDRRCVAPERVGALGLLCPAVAWVRRGFHPIVRLLRPEFGLLPHGFRR